MSTQPVNPYTPPMQLAGPEVEPGVTKCPWCGYDIPFTDVYWSSGPRITCTQCQRIAVRKKYRLPAGVSETCFFLLWVVLFPGLTAFVTHDVTWPVIAAVFGLPLFFLADYLTDRRLAYLAKPEPHQAAGVRR